MNARTAKDFLVERIVEQASIEHIPLSDLEKRMMYFTETSEMTEDPFELHAAFEAQYDSTEYENKVSKLMHNAYARIKKENPQSARTWNESVQELRKGDHYLLVLLGDFATAHVPSQKILGWGFWKLLGISFLALLIGLIALAIFLHHLDNSRTGHTTRSDYFAPTSFSNSCSVKIVTPNSFAFSNFDPGSVPTTT